MQKRNEKKKKLVCGRHGNLKISSVVHTADTSSVRYAKMPSSSKRKKEKRGKLHKFSERTLGVFVVFVIHDQKGTKRKCSGERSYPDSNRGNQKFFDISSL